MWSGGQVMKRWARKAPLLPLTPDAGDHGVLKLVNDMFADNGVPVTSYHSMPNGDRIIHHGSSW
jgi:hypothetical protein